METLEQKIRRLAQYMDDEAVARAVDRDVDFVRSVLFGEAVKLGEEQRGRTTVVHYVKPAYRQRVVYIVRVKGGVGATTLAYNIAWRVSEKIRVFVIDALAEIYGQIVVSDFTELAGYGCYRQDSWNGPEIQELAENLYFLPFPAGQTGVSLDEVVLEARNDYDAIIVDLPPLNPRRADLLKCASVLLVMCSGGEAETERVFRLLSAVSGRKELVLVNTTRRRLPEKEGLKQLYLPRADNINKGVFDVKSPAGQAVGSIIAEIWGENFSASQKERGGLLACLLRKNL